MTILMNQFCEREYSENAEQRSISQMNEQVRCLDAMCVASKAVAEATKEVSEAMAEVAKALTKDEGES